MLNNILISPETTLLEAIQVIDKAQTQVTLIVNSKKQLLGSLTDGDIRRALIKKTKLSETVESYMFKTPVTANIDESWINNEFKSWGNSLELLGHDPWYRDNTKSVKKIESAKEIEVELEEYEKIKWKNKESVNEIFENLNELKIDLMKDYKIKDSENKFAGYSHVDMLNLLEKYLKILPKNTRYSDIKNFF